MSGSATIYGIGSAVVCAALGFRLLFLTRRTLADGRARHDARLADRLARGEDAYFEELRSIQSYRPIASSAWARVAGVALLALSGAYLAFILFDLVSE